MLAGLIPIVIAWFSFSSELDQVNALQHHIFNLKDQAFIRESKQSSNMAVRSHFSDADHFYIDKNLETLNETENHSTYTDGKYIKRTSITCCSFS